MQRREVCTDMPVQVTLFVRFAACSTWPAGSPVLDKEQRDQAVSYADYENERETALLCDSGLPDTEVSKQGTGLLCPCATPCAASGGGRCGGCRVCCRFRHSHNLQPARRGTTKRSCSDASSTTTVLHMKPLGGTLQSLQVLAGVLLGQAAKHCMRAPPIQCTPEPSEP